MGLIGIGRKPGFESRSVSAQWFSVSRSKASTLNTSRNRAKELDQKTIDLFFFSVVLLQEKRCWNKVWDSTHLKESVGWRLELGSRHEDVERGE
jgi:hypothetical protein